MTSHALHVVCPHCDTTNRVPPQRLGHGGKCGACHRPLFAGAPVELTESRAEAHLRNSDIPLLVDFWAPWCGPCHAMAPQFARAATELEPDLRVAKVNVDEAPAMAAALQIQSIPTIVLFASGREIARHSGAMSAAQILSWVQPHLRTRPAT